MAKDKIDLITFPKFSPIGDFTLSASSWVSPNILNALQNDISHLNTLIGRYNQIDNIRDKQQQLQLVIEYGQWLQNLYATDNFTHMPSFSQEMHQKLYTQYLMHKELLNPAFNRYSFDSVESCIANMSPDVLNRFMTILASKKNTPKPGDSPKLDQLYTAQDNPQEAQAFKNFLNTHNITLISAGNARVFRVVRKVDNQTQVLKLDYRFDCPKDVETSLRKLFPAHFTNIYAERQSTFFHEVLNENVTCSLVVIDYCPTNLEDHAKHLSMDARAKSAPTLFFQMLDVLLQAQQAGYAWTDAKNTNWLLNTQNCLQISDPKAFVRTSGKDKIYVNYISTDYLFPPEMHNTGFEAGPMHVYEWGRNLYQFLTNCRCSDLSKHDHDLVYTNPIFSTLEGNCLKSIIKMSVCDDPLQRQSIDNLHANMKIIEHLSTITDIKEFNVVFSMLTDSSLKEQYYYSVKTVLAWGLKTCEDLSNLLYFLDSKALCQDFLQESEVREFIDKHLNTVLDSVNSINDCVLPMSIMAHFPQTDAIYQTKKASLIQQLQQILPNLLQQGDKIQNISTLLDSLPNTPGGVECIQCFQLPTILKDTSDLKQLISKNPDKTDLILQAMKGHFADLVHNKQGFLDLLDTFSDKKHRQIIFKDVEHAANPPTVSGLIKNTTDFCDIAARLTPKGVDYLCTLVKLTDIVKTIDDLEELDDQYDFTGLLHDTNDCLWLIKLLPDDFAEQYLQQHESDIASILKDIPSCIELIKASKNKAIEKELADIIQLALPKILKDNPNTLNREDVIQLLNSVHDENQVSNMIENLNLHSFVNSFEDALYLYEHIQTLQDPDKSDLLLKHVDDVLIKSFPNILDLEDNQSTLPTLWYEDLKKLYTLKKIQNIETTCGFLSLTGLQTFFDKQPNYLVAIAKTVDDITLLYQLLPKFSAQGKWVEKTLPIIKSYDDWVSLMDVILPEHQQLAIDYLKQHVSQIMCEEEDRQKLKSYDADLFNQVLSDGDKNGFEEIKLNS